MNEVLISKLNILTNDRLLMQAIYEIFDDCVEKFRPSVETTDNNSLLGEKYRAYEQARHMLEEAFKDIDTYKDNHINSKNFNKAK